jgi:hypothetical protein
MNLARKVVEGHITKDEPFDTVADITATYGRVLEDKGLIFYGDTQKGAEDDALLGVIIYESAANQFEDKETKQNQEEKQ